MTTQPLTPLLGIDARWLIKRSVAHQTPSNHARDAGAQPTEHTEGALRSQRDKLSGRAHALLGVSASAIFAMKSCTQALCRFFSSSHFSGL
eukprot:CAMPEP_0182827614 /NCGR_PEP_ID=MMETSP0006_2-20121128/17020_1 /TAXON_ID=97485 /ORGANISM="Prymnesium parvum, Strain Texoma1" /LENGTH=90 /DNA_ID=CAMNT_0024954895 /DNA_START=145 /DNA_END=417 /DNA_ORIENTATION=-